MNVMKKAWEIAKAAVVKFGGKVKEYFTESLKMAWAIAKNEAGAFNTDCIQALAKQGEYAFVAIPADVKVDRVVDGTDHVRQGNPVKNKLGQEYMMYKVIIGFNFRVDIEGASYFYKVAENNKLYFNGKK
jgi:hypothetical protein